MIRTPRRLFLFLGLCLLAARDAAGAAGCTAAPGPPYAGPLFDAMAQIESSQSPETVLQLMRASNVERMALFARLHRRRSGEGNVLQAGKASPDRIVMGAPKAFEERDDLSAAFVAKILADIPARRYAFVGEIMFTHGDKTHGEQTADGERYVSPLGQNVRRLVEGLKEHRIPVMTHWEVYDWQRDWPQMSDLYRRFPEQTFIWPHAGFADIGQIDEVLARHGNVVATLSKKEQDQRALSDNEKAARLGPALVDGCNVLKPEWKELVLRYQDRLLFATDAHKDFRWRKYGNVVETWRVILGQLPPEVAEKLAYRNAMRIYGVR